MTHSILSFFRCYSETRSASVKIECAAAAELGHMHEEHENMMLLQPPSPPYTAVDAITQVSLAEACSPGLCLRALGFSQVSLNLYKLVTTSRILK